MMEPYTYFNDADAIHSYVAHTVIEMLSDKLERMKTTDWKHYTQRDRRDMEDKIADIKLYFGMWKQGQNYCASGEGGVMTQPAKHTPGPWTARKAPERNAYAWDVEGAQGTVSTIARMALVDRVSEIEGNAHLIAAAPAMYEALKAMLGHEGERVYSGIGTEHDSEALEAAKQAARAALAQAEGKQ